MFRSFSLTAFLLSIFQYSALIVVEPVYAAEKQVPESLAGSWTLTFDPAFMLKTKVRSREEPLTVVLNVNADQTVKGQTGWSYLNVQDGISGQPAFVRGQLLNHQVVLSVLSVNSKLERTHSEFMNLKGHFVSPDEISGTVSPGNYEWKSSGVSLALPQSGRFELRRKVQ
jgi:hypothetical protein